MLKGHVFKGQIFGHHMFALFVNTFLNGRNGISNNYKNGMKVTYSGSKLVVSSGAACIQGRLIEEDSSTEIDADINAGFCKLVIEVNLNEENSVDNFVQAQYKIVKSESGYPNLTKNNIVKNNTGIYQYELARFTVNANGISNFVDKRTFLDFSSIYDEIEKHIREIDNGSLYLEKAGGTMTGMLYANGGIKGNLNGNAETATYAGKAGNAENANKASVAESCSRQFGYCYYCKFSKILYWQFSHSKQVSRS